MSKPIFVKAIDGTSHLFPPNTPQTEIEKYMWRYENGQDLDPITSQPEYRLLRSQPPRLRGSLDVDAAPRTTAKGVRQTRKDNELYGGDRVLEAIVMGNIGMVPTQRSVDVGTRALVQETAPYVRAILGSDVGAAYEKSADKYPKAEDLNDHLAYQTTRAALLPLTALRTVVVGGK